MCSVDPLGRFSRQVVLSAALVLVSCASKFSVQSMQDPDADFSAYKTYGFVSLVRTDRKEPFLSTWQHMKEAVSIEMESRGYVRSETPDILVMLYVDLGEKTRLKESPSPRETLVYRDTYYGYWDGYPGSGDSETHVVRYVEGSIVVTIFEVSRDQFVWEGRIEGIIKGDLIENAQRTTSFAASELFRRYPGIADLSQVGSGELLN